MKSEKPAGSPRVCQPGRSCGSETGVRARYMQPQQTGVPFIIMQQVQPAFIMLAMQSQQA